jgi:hypothetical protein
MARLLSAWSVARNRKILYAACWLFAPGDFIDTLMVVGARVPALVSSALPRFMNEVLHATG